MVRKELPADPDFMAVVARLKAFVDEHGRLPKSHQNDGGSPHLGRWLRRIITDQNLSPQREAVLDEQVPAWRDNTSPRGTVQAHRDAGFERVVHRLREFKGERGHYPTRSESDGLQPHLGCKMRDLRGGRGLNPERRTILDRELPGWQQATGLIFDPLDANFMELVGRLEAFRSEHGRLPSMGENDRSQLGLGYSLYRLRTRQQAEARTELLDLKLPGWRVPVRGRRTGTQLTPRMGKKPGTKVAPRSLRNESFEATVKRYAAFVQKHGRKPATTETDGPERPHLGSWLLRIRLGHTTLTPERIELLDAADPNWRVHQRADQSVTRFEETVARYAEFVQRHGRQPGCQETDDIGLPHLGSWIRKTRMGHVKLTPERIALLDAADPNWREHRTQSSFEETVSRYAAFVQQHGRQPAITETDGPERPLLGSWLVRVRRGSIVLTPERIALLDAADPNWREHKAESSFEETVARYAEFVRRHGRQPGKQETDDAGVPHLGSWIRQVRLGRINLTPERTALLDGAYLGWREHKTRTSFEETVSRYAAFVQQHGRQPALSETDGLERPHLGSWLGRIRMGHTTLTPERIALLDAADPNWRVHQDGAPFEETVARYAAFVQRHGRQPRSTETDEIGLPHLGNWIKRARKGHIKLTPERVELLDAAHPGWRKGRRAHMKRSSFEEMVSRYAEFVARHGRQPNSKETDGSEGPSLGSWMERVRTGLIELTPERIALLESANPEWREHRTQSSFKETVSRYAEFVSRHGRQPRSTETDESSAVSLGKWIIRVRASQNELTPERIALLDAAYSGWRERDSVRGR